MQSPRAGARTLRTVSGRSLTLALALSFVACVQGDGSRFNPLDMIIPNVSEDDERELGMEFDRELQKVVPVIHDPVVNDFINELGQSIVRQIEPQPFIYRFRVIDAPTLNAFAVPGGYIYFHSGTITSVASIDELAGVMGHEIAHVKKHHYARMRTKSQIPDLLIGLAGMAAAVATEEPGILMASQAANVAMQLRYTREYEAEADRFGSVFMVRAGYAPRGIVRFFERILDAEKRDPVDLPPYLFSHPEIEDRIGAIEIAAESLQPTQTADPKLEAALPAVQARLARLKQANRTDLPPPAAASDRGTSPMDFAEAQALADAGDLETALRRLAAAEAANPDDPRIPYLTGELLFEAGRFEEAAARYRRTTQLDSSRAKVFYQMGLAYKEIGDRPRAVNALEQASVRAGNTSTLRERADWEVFKLTFTILLEVGFANGEKDGDTPSGAARDHFVQGVPQLAWWARVNPRFQHWIDDFSLRWSGPDGRVAQDDEVEKITGTSVGSSLRLAEGAAAGTWTAELHLNGEVVDRRTVEVRLP